MQRAQHVDELVAEAVLERHPADVDPARHQHDLLVLDVDAAERADALGEREHLRLAERLGGEPAPLPLVDDRRVEALLDRRPDRERRREVVAVDHQVGAVAHADLVDPAEQVVGGVAGGDVGEPGLDAHAHERQLAALGPPGRVRELGVAEHHADLAERVGRVRLGHVHRHVDVVAAGGEGAVEDRRVEAGIAGVEHDVGSARRRQLGDGSADDASTVVATTRSPRSLQPPCWRRTRPDRAEMSATVMCSIALRRDAIVTNAEPTPPAPTTSTRMPER